MYVETWPNIEWPPEDEQLREHAWRHLMMVAQAEAARKRKRVRVYAFRMSDVAEDYTYTIGDDVCRDYAYRPWEEPARCAHPNHPLFPDDCLIRKVGEPR
jgi:hypothetical protein